MRYNGKTVVITGGAGGLGRAFGLGFAAEGGSVVLADIDADRLTRNAAEIKAVNGGRCETALCDVTRANEVEAMVSHAMACFGSVDILINNAGGSLGVPKVPIDQVDEHDWDRVMDLNLKGTFLCTRAVAGHMKKAGKGKIVNLSSITARVGGQLTPVQYVSAKGGVIAFTRQVAQELGPSGINVNAVAPGIVLSGERLEKMWYERKTEEERSDYLSQVPLRRLGSPEEIAEAVLFLCSSAADLITGVTLDINGGLFSV